MDVEEDESRGAAGVLSGQRNGRDPEHRQRGFVVLSDDEEVMAALPTEGHLGRSLD